MISISKIAPPVIGIGIATVYAASVASVLFMVGGALFSDSMPYHCNSYDRSFVGELRELGKEGSSECELLVSAVADRISEGDYNLHYVYEISECYERVGDNESEYRFSRLLVDEFPTQFDFYNLLAIAELDRNDVAGAKETLEIALELPNLSPQDSATLHNNYAWALLSEENPDLKMVDVHSDAALELNPYACPLIHTRLTYEFGININKPSVGRDLTVWFNIREEYNKCLEMYRHPKYRENGNFTDDTISAEVFSTFVMDSMVWDSNVDVPIEAASYLSPVAGTLNREGLDQFCRNSMGLRDDYVQGACKNVAKQVNYWARGSFLR